MVTNKGVLSILALTILYSGFAQSVEIPANYGYNFLEQNNINPNISTLTSNLFGDKIDYNTGSVSFAQTDIDIPGNFDIPVRLTRKLSGPDAWYKEPLELGTWSIDIPHVRSAFISREGDHKQAYWAEGKACTKPLNTNEDFYSATWNGETGDNLNYVASRQQYWNGDTIYIPGKGSTKITQKNAVKTNNKQWTIECLTNNVNEGYKVTTKDGKVYHFEKYRAVKSEKEFLPTPIVTPSDQCTTNCAPPSIGGGEPTIPHVKYDYYNAFLLATKITDIHGNWVKYDYDANGVIKKIYSSDGREIELTIEGGRLTSASANNKTWSYRYATTHFPFYLEKVIRPDGKSWTYDYNQSSGDSVFNKINLSYYTQLPVPGYSCAPFKNKNFISMTHPDGVTGVFDLKEHCHNLTEVPKIRRLSINGYSSSQFDEYFVAPGSILYSLSKKRLELNDNEVYEWNYNYSGTWHAFKGDELSSHHRLDVEFGIDSAHLKSTTVTYPDNSKEIMYFERRYAQGSDLLYHEWYNKTDSLLKRLSYKYLDGYDPGHTSIWAYAGSSPDPYTMDDLISSRSPQRLQYQIKTELFEGSGSVSTYWNKLSQLNAYDVFELKEEANSFTSNKLFTRTEYLHDTSKWLINLPVKRYVSKDSTFSVPYEETTYVTGTNLLLQKSFLGQNIQVNSYHADGSLKETNYLGSGRYEQFDDYFRGKARKVTLPCAITNGCNTANGSTANTIIAKVEVNGDGTTSSITDFNGNKTNYGYNLLGWLTNIDYADSRWTDKTISYANVTVAGDGISGSAIAVGQLKQTITQGHYEQRIYHDALLRPVLTRTLDKTDAGSVIYQRKAFDHKNQPTLTSFPSASASSTTGIVSEHDVLGRLVATTRQSDGATSKIEYLSGNTKRVTDAEGNVTTTTYLAYGSPSYGKSTLIQTPDSEDTRISYNQFGQVTAISQGTVTEKRLYDAYQQLCKTYRPETGVTAYGYNTVRQPIWRAEGTDGGSTSCAASSVPVDHKVLLSYDNLGQLHSEDFPDNTPDNTYSYDANGKLSSLVSGAGNSAISWSYLYNSQNLIEKETLTLDDKSFVLDWGYNALGAVSSLKYPSGKTMSYGLNALGQAIKVSDGTTIYANYAKYHPNGQLKQLTYGNGLVRNVSLDSSGRIDAITDSSGSRFELSLDPSYDLNDNLTGLTDGVDSRNSITNISHDGLDRLIGADGKWGSGSYSYDGLGNINTRSISGSSISYHYNSLNRLNNLSGAYAYSYAYDARGSVVHNGRYGLTFNRANQVVEAKGISYRYDGHNRRVKKNGDYSVYSQSGQLLYRLNTNGIETDSVYLNKQIIAEIDRK
ncbi:RHS repeat domain-containing protein [Shewanella sp. 125m-1]